MTKPKGPRCPLCGKPEGRERCHWPMTGSPLSFGWQSYKTTHTTYVAPDRFMEDSLRMAVMGVE